ncbi:hypothetical protein EV1_023776 [Malus domestica]
MNSDKVDFVAKVAPRPTHFAAETDSPARKEETARVGSCEKSTKPAFREAIEICVLLKLDLLEDMDVCVNKAAKEVAKTMAAEAYSSAEEIKMLDFELVALKRSNISALTFLQLETVRQDIVDFETKLDAIQVKNESAEKEIRCYIPQIQDLEFAISELCFAAYAKDEELIAAYNQKEVDELQHVRVGLLKKNKQLKVGEVSAQAGAVGGEVQDDATAKSVTAVEVEDHLSGCFGRPIALRISWLRHVLLDAIFLEELRQIFAYELRTVVSDNGLKDAKSANDVPPYEVLYVRLNRGRHGLCFYLFGEVVGCHDHLAFAPSSSAGD